MSQAAEKALSVLEHVAANAEPLSVMSVAESLNLDKSTCSRLLALLTEQGWLVRDGRTRTYSVGPTLVRLGASAAMNHHLQLILLPLLTALRDETGETVSFHRRIGLQRVCVAGLESAQPIRRALPLGEAFPLHRGPSGKVILAFLPESLRDECVGAAPAGQRGALLADLAIVVRDGALSSDDDPVAEVGALSVPVFDRASVFASLTVAGPSHRWNGGRRADFTPSLLAAGQSLSATLGAISSPHQHWMTTHRLQEASHSEPVMAVLPGRQSEIRG